MSDVEIAPELLAKLLDQIGQVPGIPVPNHTVSAWQVPQHPLAEVQSKSLPQTVDFAIIGSGITGCSVAKCLLENDKSATKSVTVFDARRMTTGATSRNGGFLMAHAPTFFSSYQQAFGIETAIKISRFCERTLAEIRRIAQAEGLWDEAQIREVETVINFEDEEGLAQKSEAIRRYMEHCPEFEGQYTPMSKEVAKQKYGLRKTVGGWNVKHHAFWPYRLVTGLFQRLLDRYPGRFTIECMTPITSITVSEDNNKAYPYILTTPRGIVRAAKVFHCTGGFTGHLLPRLRGPIYPNRIHMSAATADAEFGNRRISWLWHVPVRYEAESRLVDMGLFWMQQNAKSGDLFFGGDRQKLDDFLTSDDSAVSAEAAENLRTLLPQRLFAKGFPDPATGQQKSALKPHHEWCGIISMTADKLAIVGPVPTNLSGRKVEGGEWVVSGCNGYGMGQFWSAGEAIARMALGEPKPAWLPDVYLSTEERLSGASMSKEAGLEAFFKNT